MENQDIPEVPEKAPAGKKKLYIALAAVALVIVAVIAVIALIPEKTTLGEAFAGAECNHTAHVTMYRGPAFAQQVITHEAMTIWETIRDSELQIVDAKKNGEIKSSILGSDYIQYWAYGVESIYLYVSRSGLVSVEYFPSAGGVHYYSYRNGEAVYEALNSFVPTEGHIAIADVLPDLEWEEIVLYVTANGTSSGKVYFDTPQEINAILEGLETMVFPYGGAEDDYNAYMKYSLELHTADWLVDRDAYYISFDQDGNGKVWMGQWSYSVSGGDQLTIFLADFIS